LLVRWDCALPLGNTSAKAALAEIQPSPFFDAREFLSHFRQQVSWYNPFYQVASTADAHLRFGCFPADPSEWKKIRPFRADVAIPLT
jgi:hypothetical protein